MHEAHSQDSSWGCNPPKKKKKRKRAVKKKKKNDDEAKPAVASSVQEGDADYGFDLSVPQLKGAFGLTP
jgi:hypothetical protein